MTTDIRTAAQREAERRWPDTFVGQIAAKHDFVHGAEWAAKRVTPTREQIAEVLDEDRYYDPDQISNLERADAILALMAGLAEENHGRLPTDEGE